MYDPQAQNGPPADADSPVDIAAFLESLEPSFLKYDYDGRVVRLDTFSKVCQPCPALLVASRLTKRDADACSRLPRRLGRGELLVLGAAHPGERGAHSNTFWMESGQSIIDRIANLDYSYSMM